MRTYGSFFSLSQGLARRRSRPSSLSIVERMRTRGSFGVAAKGPPLLLALFAGVGGGGRGGGGGTGGWRGGGLALAGKGGAGGVWSAVVIVGVVVVDYGVGGGDATGDEH